MVRGSGRADESGMEHARRRPFLSPRERDVLCLLAEGCSNDDVGLALQISPATVRSHLANAKYKLGAANRTAAVARALREQLIS
jgi:DNA-binding NarL/FixJ family response regulator